MRNLILVFGDQLDWHAAVFKGFDPQQDAVWMAEADHESTFVWSAKQRIALFLSAMRHFRDDLRKNGITVHYTELSEDSAKTSLSELLKKALMDFSPQQVLFTRPGEWRILKGCERILSDAGISFQCIEDAHFFTTPDEFSEHAKGRRSLRMEFFYRDLRKRKGILMEHDGKPCGGSWNFDQDNRESFPKGGPGKTPSGPSAKVDTITREVIKLVNNRFASHPGTVDSFQWPVTRSAALDLLENFIEYRLAKFGSHQDAMWKDHHWLYHSWISAALNLKLLSPAEVCAAAESAWRKGNAPINAVEGFIRQILGWREYVRGVYWHFMPDYLDLNTLEATEKLPSFYWDGDTPYACLKATIRQTLDYGYAHHIQRLMVTGLYALLLGVEPRRVHEWYLAVYVDAVEWVELPNVLGMSQYADGGIMASKPYAATGKYIQRMSNYCDHCPKNPSKRTGQDACPFTTLYWDFILRHKKMLSKNQRMAFQVKNLDRIDENERKAIREQALKLKEESH